MGLMQAAINATSQRGWVMHINKAIWIQMLLVGVLCGIHGEVLAQKPGASGVKTEKVQKTLSVQLALMKSKPPQLAITAFGQVNSGGWKNGALQPRIYIQPPQDGIQDLDFVAEPPSGPATQVISPITAHYVMISIPSWLKGVRVHSSTNNVESKLSGASSLELN